MRRAGLLLALLAACEGARPTGIPLPPGAGAAGEGAERPPPTAESPVLPPEVPATLPSGELPAALAADLEVIAARFVARFTAEHRLPEVGRHVAALLLREVDPDALRAAAALLGRPDPPAALRAELFPGEAQTLARALLDPASIHPTSLAVALSRLVAVGREDRLPLLQVLRTTDDPSPTLLLSVGRCGEAGDIFDLRPYLQAESVPRRHAAAAAGAALGDAKMAGWLREILEGSDPAPRREVAVALALVGPTGLAGDLLAKAVRDPDPDVALPAAVGLLEAGDPGLAGKARLLGLAERRTDLLGQAPVLRGLRFSPPVPSVLLPLLLGSGTGTETRVEAALALARQKNAAAGLLCRLAIERGALPEVCLGARALVALEGEDAVWPVLLRRIDASAVETRAAAAFALGELGGPAVAQALAQRRPRGDPAVAAAWLGAAAAR